MAEQSGPVLQRAVESGQEQQVREMLKQQDIDVNEQAEAGWTALLYATAGGYPRIVRLLLNAGANPDMGNVHGFTPLMYGARYKNVDVCKLLLEHGANLDLQDVYGMTALMVATCVGSGAVAGRLLKAGANTNIKDRNDMTALDIAHKLKQGKIAKIIRTRKKIAASRP
jgi:ankyrin repeat protein